MAKWETQPVADSESTGKKKRKPRTVKLLIIELRDGNFMLYHVSGGRRSDEEQRKFKTAKLTIGIGIDTVVLTTRFHDLLSKKHLKLYKEALESVDDVSKITCLSVLQNRSERKATA